MATKRPQSQSVVLATLVLAAFVPTIGAITNCIQSRALAVTVQQTHTLVNSRSESQITQIKDLIQANKDLANKVAVLEERLKPVNTGVPAYTLTDQQFNLLQKRKE